MGLEREVSFQDPDGCFVEEHGFLAVEGARLAYARCLPQLAGRSETRDFNRFEGASRVVVIGPIGAERERAHRAIVELSRALARRGHEVFRYDHRGLGESTGNFEDATVGGWSGDARRVLEATKTVTDVEMRTTIVGVRIGALLASELFAEGHGNAAIFIGEGDGHSLLRDASRRALVAGFVAGSIAGQVQAGASHDERSADVSSTSGRVSATHGSVGYASIAAGAIARVDGYLWTPAFVVEAATHRFRAPDLRVQRPWAKFELVGSAAPVKLSAQRQDPSASSRDRAEPDVAKRTMRVHARRFWESSPSLTLEDETLVDAIAAWIECNVLRSAVASEASGGAGCMLQ